MDIVLRPVLWKKAMVYINNVNIYSESFEQHIEDIQEMQFLGHIVGIEGIKPDPQKVDKLDKLPPPKNITQLRAFLGLASYYRQKAQNNIFNWLKQCLTQASILQYPDYSEPFVLFIDASYQGLGAVLSQIKNGREHVIAYANRTLTPAESNYSTIELECLAVIWAVKYFRHYTWNKIYSYYKSQSTTM
ncbi:18066_t:CDS:2, partial [Gigaspora rosea]